MATDIVPSTPPRRTARSARRGAAVALAVAGLVLAACGDDDTTEAGGSAGDGGGPTISVVTPDDGAAVDGPFEVEVDTDVDLGEPDTGLHHVHLYYDGNTQEGEYDLVYGTTFTVDRSLDPGEHTIEAVVANADHSLTDARDEVTVTVGGAGAGTGDQPEDSDTTEGTDATTTDDGGYDY